MNKFTFGRTFLTWFSLLALWLVSSNQGMATTPDSTQQTQTAAVSTADGKKIFMERCAACHSTSSQKLTGPGLAGINQKRSKEWLLKWIRNSQELVTAGDADAVAIFEEFNKIPMIPFLDLSDAQIESILAYVDEANKPAAKPTTTAALGDKPSTEAQTKEWTETSQGLTAVTIIPLIMLALLLIILWMAGQKIPGMD